MELSAAANIWFFVGVTFALSGGVTFTFGARQPRTGRIRMIAGAMMGLVPFALGIWFGLKLGSSLGLWFNLLFAQMPTCVWPLALMITDAFTGRHVLGRHSAYIVVNGKRDYYRRHA